MMIVVRASKMPRQRRFAIDGTVRGFYQFNKKAVEGDASMIRAYFKEWGTGRLRRLPYLGYSLLLIPIIAVIQVAVFLLTTVTMSANGEVPVTELGMPGGIILIVVGILVTIVGANLGAKRIRDMGLTGWRYLILVSIGGSLLGVLADYLSGSSSNGQVLFVAMAIHVVAGLGIALFFLLTPSDFLQTQRDPDILPRD